MRLSSFAVAALLLASCSPDEPVEGVDPVDIAPPAAVTDLAATPGEGSITLAWTYPADADLYACELRRLDGTTAPASRAAGELLTTLTSLTPGDVGNFNDGPVSNGQPYSYTIFCRDTVANWQTSVDAGNTESAIPVDVTPPSVVTDLVAMPGDGRVALAWTHPAATDLHSCELRRLDGTTPPANTTEGVTVTTINSPTPGDAGNHSDVAVINGQQYSYTIFCRDIVGNWQTTVSPGNTESAIPVDTTVPLVVGDLVAVPGDGMVALAWTYPADSDLHSCELRRLDGTTAPASRADGELLTTLTSPTPGDAGNHSDAAVINGQQYSYTIFCRDFIGNWQTTVNAGNTESATPLDMTPPAVVTNLAAAPGDTNDTLTWTYPNVSDLHSCVVRRLDGPTPPATPTSGVLVVTLSLLLMCSRWASTVLMLRERSLAMC
jgi:hypothetical protein